MEGAATSATGKSALSLSALASYDGDDNDGEQDSSRFTRSEGHLGLQ